MSAIDALSLAVDCANNVYRIAPPSIDYTNRVITLLMGTGAQESGFRTRRQTSFPWASDEGGFGWWQCERGSITDSLIMLRRNLTLADRVSTWLWQDIRANRDWLALSTEGILWMMRGWDRLGVLMCRLHYLRKIEPIPAGLPAQAEYWLEHYNCGGALKRLTKEQALQQYIDNYNKIVLPVWKGA